MNDYSKDERIEKTRQQQNWVMLKVTDLGLLKEMGMLLKVT